MAFVRAKARIRERSTTSGSGPFTLAGAVDTSYNAFSSFLSDGDTCFATVVEPAVAFWTGIVTYHSAGPTITLTGVVENKGTFGSGTKELFPGARASDDLLREDISGAIVTGGTATAYTVASFTKYASLAALNGQMIAFVPHATNTNTVGADVTLALDSLTAKPIRMQPGVALPNGTLILGTPYFVTYNNTDGVFYLRNMTNPYAVPLGGLMDFIGSSVPNSCYLFPAGQAISRTTYATLFALVGTAYGIGDGSTTFNVPDLTGRVVAMKEATATRLTSGGGGVDGGTLGAAGGAQTETLTLGQLPTGITVTGTVTVTPSGGKLNIPTTDGSISGSDYNNGAGALGPNFPTSTSGGVGDWTGVSRSLTGSNTLTSNNTSGSAHVNVQPTIVLNKILRVI